MYEITAGIRRLCALLTYQCTPILHIVQVSVSMSTEVQAGGDP